MSVFTASERIPGINITLGESVNIPTAMLTRQHRPKHARSNSEATKLPPAVAAVPADHIRGYVHSKRVNSYLVGSTLGEGSFAKVKEGFHVLVGEKARKCSCTNYVYGHAFADCGYEIGRLLKKWVGLVTAK